MVAAVLMATMKPQPTHRARMYLELHREYRLYYVLSILYGSRKQLFITFAPWVIVTIFNQPTQTLATLITIGGIIGISSNPCWVGLLIAWVSVPSDDGSSSPDFVCLGYGFVKELFPTGIAFLLVCVFYLLDQMLMSVNMARAMYMKKIAIRPEDVQPALTVSVTLITSFQSRLH